MGNTLAYIKAIKDNTGYYGIWEPFKTYKLGDYGKFNKKGQFTKLGNVTNYKGITFKTSRMASPTVDNRIESGKISRTEVETTGDGSGYGVKVQGKMTMTFEEKDQVVYEAVEQVHLEVEDKMKLAKDILNCKEMKNRWWVIMEIVEAKNVVLIISQENNSEITIHGEAKKIGTNMAASANLEFGKQTWGFYAKTLKAGGKCTPMANFYKVKKKGSNLTAPFAKMAKLVETPNDTVTLERYNGEAEKIGTNTATSANVEFGEQKKGFYAKTLKAGDGFKCTPMEDVYKVKEKGSNLTASKSKRAKMEETPNVTVTLKKCDGEAKKINTNMAASTATSSSAKRKRTDDIIIAKKR
eukprot:CAMPEP_0178904790 /NCGR_PEP_ID=MMETSP0786-20121207/5892_1 /TAXON_ID=186022 /ORGANISM="Thalassionema frauenfeldii, Strain CCMP 1798" /LENGTH=353 /DNA_ID=CAMNT_0020576279 /DNA_START=151 /DNA_END=1212 /DNA_ORIENTATION=+